MKDWYQLFLQRANRGKAFLHVMQNESKGWRMSNIDLKKLDQASISYCAAAQFCGVNYTWAMTWLAVPTRDESRDLGFQVGSDTITELMRENDWSVEQANEWAYYQLTHAWLEVLGTERG